MRKEYTCEIVSKKRLNEDTVLLEIACPEIADSAVPGQFVNVSCSYFLKRPFGIADVDKSSGTFYIGVKEVGKGSKELNLICPGEKIDVLGPLGNGFDIASDGKYILVAGGTGVFPVNFAHKFMSEKGISHKVVQGFRSADQIIMYEPGFILTTDCGDMGIEGNCCDGLNTLTEDDLSDAAVLCVGPLPMMKAVGKWAADHGLKCFVSMEQRMACGIGICLVCICKIKAESEGQEFDHKRCCKDGPVFPYEEVIW